MTRRRRRLGIVAVVILVLVSGGAAGAVSLGDSSTTTVSIAMADGDPDEEDDIRHEHPDDAETDDGDDELADWLANQVSESIGESTVALSEGEYDAAREVLGEEYDDRLAQLAEVDGDTDDDTEEADEDDEAEALNEVIANQDEFIDATEEYETTREEYEQALADGDDDRARELARQMEEAEQRVTEASETLDRSFSVLSERTGADMSSQRESVNQTSTEISQTQSEIRDTEFVETELTVDTENEAGSATDPIRITGELTAADDSVLDDERILIEVEGRTTETTTENGTFTLDYRPALLDADADSVAVEFVPDPASPYLGATADAQVAVTPTEPTIELESIEEPAGYGDEVTVRGTVHVDGMPVDQLPVNAQFGEQVQGDVVRTADDGSFNATVTVPADIEDGETDVAVVYSQTERALTPTSESTQLQLTSTPTRIDADVTVSEDDTVFVTGTLTTDDGVPVPGQSVQFEYNGSTVETVATDKEGAFEETVEVSPETVPEDGLVELTVVFTGSESNLDGSEDAVSAALTPSDTGGVSSVIPVSPWSVAGAFGLLSLLVLGGLFVGRRVDGLPVPDFFGRGDDDGADRLAPTESAHTSDGYPTDSVGRDPLDETPARLLEDGRPNEAVIVAYEQARNRLAQHLDTDQPRTYWEFYQDWQADVGNDSELLRTLTEQYERATFTADQIDSEDANAAIERAIELADSEST